LIFYKPSNELAKKGELIKKSPKKANKMGAITNKCFESIEEGRYVEERRPSYPLPSFEDWCAARGFDRPGVAGDDKEDRSKIAPPAKGEPQEVKEDLTKNENPQTIAGSEFRRKFEITTNQITMSNLCNSLQELWLPVCGYEGLYQVSNQGRIKSLFARQRQHSELIMKQREAKGRGYLYVGLYKEGKTKYYRVHRIVAKAFLPNPNNLPQVNHIDLNKANNCVENLEWCTGSENCLHYSRLNPGKGNPASLKEYYEQNDQRIRIIATIDEKETEYNSILETSKVLGISMSTIYKQLNGLAKGPFKGITLRRASKII
jgi:hypothetical protein